MKPAPFEYHRAYDVPQALELLTELGSDAKILAGGQSLVAMMNFRLARPSALIDINSLTELDFVRLDDGALRIGALTRHRTIELAAADLVGYEFLGRAARWVGHLPIRTRGTFGGSVAHADPAAEWCIVALLLDADIVIEGRTGRRTVAAADFFRGFLTTALEPDELLVEVVVPRPAPHAALVEYARRAGDFAIVAASASLQLVDDRCASASIVIGGVAASPLRLPEAEAVLAGEQLTPALFAEAADVAAGAITPTADVHGNERYRCRLTRNLLRRALAEATSDAA